MVLEGGGREAQGGSGTAAATIEARLHDEGSSTRVTVRTDLNVTGRPAQPPAGGLLQERPGQRAQVPEAIDLVGTLGVPMAKQLGPALAGLMPGLLVGSVLGRRRPRAAQRGCRAR